MSEKVENKAVKATVWSVVSSFVSKGVTFITLPIFTRMLTTEQYGNVSLYMSLYSILCLIIPLNVSNSMSKAYYEYKEDIYSYMSSILFLSMSSVILTFFGVLLYQKFTGIQLMEDTLLIALFLSLLVCEGTSCFVWYNRYSLNYRVTNVITLWNIIADALFSLLFIFLLDIDKGVARILGSSTVVIFLGTAVSIYIYSRGKTLVNWKYWKFALLYAISGIMYSIGGQILGQSDKLMIKHFWNNSAVALYSVPYNVSGLLVTFWSCILMGFTPWMFNKLSKKEYHSIEIVIKKISNLGILATIWLVALGPIIIQILAGSMYLEAVRIVPPVVVGVYISCIVGFQINIENYNKKPHYSVICICVGAVVNVMLNFVLLRQHGYVIAAYTSEIGYIVMYLLHTVMCKIITKEKIVPTKRIVRDIIVVIICTEIIGNLYTERTMMWGCTALISVVWLYFNRRDIRFYIKLIKTRKISG